ncbi:hypothetical protein Pdca_34290 [Pseudonocardia autotrophica]|nr:hypothetical protein Pdca_34290 [Pseudonocardia autotrophica]
MAGGGGEPVGGVVDLGGAFVAGGLGLVVTGLGQGAGLDLLALGGELLVGGGELAVTRDHVVDQGGALGREGCGVVLDALLQFALLRLGLGVGRLRGLAGGHLLLRRRQVLAALLDVQAALQDPIGLLGGVGVPVTSAGRRAATVHGQLVTTVADAVRAAVAGAAAADPGLGGLAQQIDGGPVETGVVAVVRRPGADPVALTGPRHEHAIRGVLARELPSVLRGTVPDRGQELLGQLQPGIDRTPGHIEHRAHHRAGAVPLGAGPGPVERLVRRGTHLRQGLTGLLPAPGPGLAHQLVRAVAQHRRAGLAPGVLDGLPDGLTQRSVRRTPVPVGPFGPVRPGAVDQIGPIDQIRPPGPIETGPTDQIRPVTPVTPVGTGPLGQVGQVGQVHTSALGQPVQRLPTFRLPTFRLPTLRNLPGHTARDSPLDQTLQ